jgi:BirA family biotin operon repressor/biotin-[acetyl-CoA-carboxylase] ligase
MSDERDGSADERLLALLRAGGFVSGEQIAAALGVSRAAVGKRVAELRKRGFAIAASPRLGYRLDAIPDTLDAGAVASRLTTAWLGRAWRHLPSIGSTNDEAAAWARAGAPAGAVVVADELTRGRGRLGRRWHSPPGESLYYSVVLRPPLPPHRVPPLTLAAGVAVAEALVGLDIVPQLKWPNDVLIDGKKVAGILTEMSSDLDRVHHVVVGIGVNLNTLAFPDELVAIATSAALARGGAAVGRADFAASLSARLEHWFDHFVSDGTAAVTAAWKQHARFFGRRVRVTAGRDVLEGLAEDLDDDGALRLRLDDGRVTRIIAGEVIPLAANG